MKEIERKLTYEKTLDLDVKAVSGKGGTHLSDALEVVGDKDAMYNQYVVNLIADKQVMSRILKFTVEECFNMDLDEIVAGLGEPSVMITPLDPGLTNFGKISGLQNVDVVQNEGTNVYDLRFDAYFAKLNVKFLFNVEAQRMTSKTKLGYSLENRMVFYLARIVSAQKDTEFINSNYQDMKKAVTIWIVPLPKTAEDGSIEALEMVPRVLYGKPTGILQGGLMRGILISFRKGRNFQESRNELIRFLEELLGSDSFEEKKEKLVREHGVVMDVELEGKVEKMCDFASLEREEGREEGIKIGINIYKELQINFNDTMKNIKEKFQLEDSEAEKYMQLYW